MTKTCAECVRKHWGSAQVVIPEVFLGYVDNHIRVIGELNQAEQEAFKEDLELAIKLREYRTMFEAAVFDMVIGVKTPADVLAGFDPTYDLSNEIESRILGSVFKKD